MRGILSQSPCHALSVPDQAVSGRRGNDPSRGRDARPTEATRFSLRGDSHRAELSLVFEQEDGRKEGNESAFIVFCCRLGF
jgi:hypothetical protein